MRALFFFVFSLFTLPVLAQETVNIRPDLPSVTVDTAQGAVEIARNPDVDALLSEDWARISRPCPPFCIQPIVPAEGVTPIGELEVLEFLQDPNKLLVDSRTLKWYTSGTIPGSVSIPFGEVADRLDELGCEIDFDGWDCTGAKDVALFCNGMWCGQSPTAIRAMIAAGYPAERIYYYRGGMQDWHILGLTVVPGE
ncbi:MAG TPA: rhodanese-like domain-containing protein [Aliiroseovarius sp.]|nr:rhodanese-like domain-containing protein [Aliiroseovarius sp.]